MIFSCNAFHSPPVLGGMCRGTTKNKLEPRMKCPKCTVTLLLAERQGVEIDYCPECRGIWLDRGELDKIIEKTSAQEQPAAQHRPQAEPTPHAPYQQPMPAGFGASHHDGHGSKHGQGHGYGHKKKSMLGELFDF